MTINLYQETNNSSGLQTGSSGDTFVASTTTASNGTYSFTETSPGTYYVQESVPSGYHPDGRRAERERREHLLHDRRRRRPQLFRV